LPDFTSPQGEPTGALYGFSSMLLKILSDLKPDYLAACYDLPEPTFRHEFYDKYKAHRPKTDSALSMQIDRSKEILAAFGVPVFEMKGFEADDLLASITEKTKEQKNLETVIVTGDLDTLQLVGKNVEVFAMKKGIGEAVMYGVKEVKERYGFEPELLPDYKGLVGDPSDNILGVKGIGEKTATILITNFSKLEKIYEAIKKDRSVFEKLGIKPRAVSLLEENEEEAFFSRVLAETRKDAPVGFDISSAEFMKKLDRKKIENIFKNYGFRSLINRLPYFSGAAETFAPEKSAPEAGDAGATAEFSEEIKIMYWLLDSRRVNPDMEEILEFSGRPAAETRDFLFSLIKKGGLEEVYESIEKPLIPVLKKMERQGMLLDTDYLAELSSDYHRRIKESEKKIFALAGEEFNVNSPKQLGAVLFEKMKISASGVKRTSTGARSTSFPELEKIRDRHPIIEEIFSFREISKLTSTYVDALPKLVDKDKRLRTNFNQTGTTTGRLSSSEPNLQNLPVRTEFGKAIRRAFVAPEGKVIVSCDYSQIELRVAAYLSRDEKMNEAFEKGEDIHTRVAAEVFNVPLKNVDSEMRRRAKVINFGILYGMGINSLRRSLGCSREEAEIFYDEYFRDFSGMRDYLDEIVSRARKDGFVSTLFGRRRYVPEINSPVEYIRKEGERMAISTHIQGTATGDIIKLAMAKTDEVIGKSPFKKGISMILQIHDELLFEVDNGIIKEAVTLIKKTMEDRNVTKVPLIVDAAYGANWGELKKF
jgi:DNA polymerase-1